jgi:hypothetical protein
MITSTQSELSAISEPKTESEGERCFGDGGAIAGPLFIGIREEEGGELSNYLERTDLSSAEIVYD